MPNEGQHAFEPPVILVAEDDPGIRAGLVDLLSMTLDPAPKAILQANNGREALEQLARQTPDLIISDVEMPGVDGYSLLTAVRREPARVHIPIILLTARGSHADVTRGRLTGAESYIVKPFSGHELVERVATLLSKSQREQATRRQRIEHLKRDILRMLQHEFRTPLTYVTAYLEFLWIGYTETDNLHELTDHLNGIRSGSARLMRLVSDLVEALEIRTGERAAANVRRQRRVPEVADIARAALAAIREDQKSGDLTFHSDLPQTLPAVIADPLALREILDRLLDNAVKFTRAKGAWGNVYLRGAVQGQTLVLEVRDDGIGFPPHVRETIFDLFYQHDRHYWEQQGSGVGLTIARDLARLQGGDLVAEGTPDAGARFTLLLPLASADGNEAGRATSVRPRVNLLIVEDDVMLREGLSDLLEFSAGAYRYDVQTAGNGREALQKLATFVPHLILCDIGMPQMNGYSFLEAVRQNPQWLDIQFVFLTAYGDPRDIHRGHVLGVDEYITKPYDSQLLLQIIETRLNRYFEQTRGAAHDFELLKQQMLAAISGNILDSLSAIALHSSEMRDLIDGSAIQSSQTMDDLKQSLLGIQTSSAHLVQMIQNATTLIELRTGATAEAFQQRSRPTDDLVELLGMLTDNLLADYGAAGRAIPTLGLMLPASLPPVRTEARAFEMLVRHAGQYLLLHSERGITTTLLITAQAVGGPQGSAVEITLNSTPLRAGAPAEDQVAAFLAGGSKLNDADEGATDLAIAREAALLHGGQLRYTRSGDAAILTITLPTVDSIR